MKKKKKKTLCERHYHNYANAKQTKGKPLLWLHMNPSATLYRLLRTIVEHLGTAKVFSIKQIVCPCPQRNPNYYQAKARAFKAKF